MKKTLSLLLATGLVFSLAACNTVAGIGEDITSASEGVQNEIEKSRQEREKEEDKAGS